MPRMTSVWVPVRAMATAQTAGPGIFRGAGITLDLARPDPAQIENFRPGGEGLICLDQGEGGQAVALGQQGGIALGAAGVGGVENGDPF